MQSGWGGQGGEACGQWGSRVSEAGVRPGALGAEGPHPVAQQATRLTVVLWCCGDSKDTVGTLKTVWGSEDTEGSGDIKDSVGQPGQGGAVGTLWGEGPWGVSVLVGEGAL